MYKLYSRISDHEIILETWEQAPNTLMQPFISLILINLPIQTNFARFFHGCQNVQAV